MDEMAILREVYVEQARQLELWGVQDWLDGSGPDKTLLGQKFSQLAQMCRRANDDGALTWAGILSEEFFEALAESDSDKLRDELIQVAAVAASWVNAIDRRRTQGLSKQFRKWEKR